MADSITNEPNDSDFLVMATALHGLSEEAMSKGGRNITACGRLILQQTLYWQNRWTKDTRFALYGDMNNTKVSDLYETLISMTRCDDPIHCRLSHVTDISVLRLAYSRYENGLTAESMMRTLCACSDCDRELMAGDSILFKNTFSVVSSPRRLSPQNTDWGVVPFFW